MANTNTKAGSALRKRKTQSHQQRQIKIFQAHSEYQTRKAPYEVHTWLTPSILIRGVWLREAGFEIGDYVQIDVSQRQLIITLKE